MSYIVLAYIDLPSKKRSNRRSSTEMLHNTSDVHPGFNVWKNQCVGQSTQKISPCLRIIIVIQVFANDICSQGHSIENVIKKANVQRLVGRFVEKWVTI